MDIGYFLKLMAEKGASDMFLTTGAPVNIKVEGKLYPLGNTGLPPGMVKKIAYSLMDEGQVPQFEKNLELNMAIAVKDAGPLPHQRVQAARRSRHGDPRDQERDPDDRATAPAATVQELIMEPRGLILAGRRDRLGQVDHARVDDRSSQRECSRAISSRSRTRSNICYRHKKSVVNQREVGLDTHSYHEALKNAMREAPDVILIGEIRDADTMEAAIAFSETGHLCLATLHSNNADQTIERILNFFPRIGAQEHPDERRR